MKSQCSLWALCSKYFKLNSRCILKEHSHDFYCATTCFYKNSLRVHACSSCTLGLTVDSTEGMTWLFTQNASYCRGLGNLPHFNCWLIPHKPFHRNKYHLPWLSFSLCSADCSVFWKCFNKKIVFLPENIQIPSSYIHFKLRVNTKNSIKCQTTTKWLILMFSITSEISYTWKCIQ